jgi:hypothetical protein
VVTPKCHAGIRPIVPRPALSSVSYGCTATRTIRPELGREPNQIAEVSVAVIYGTVAVIIVSDQFGVAGAAAMPNMAKFERLSDPRKLSRQPRSDLTFAVSHPDGTLVHGPRNKNGETAR